MIVLIIIGIVLKLVYSGPLLYNYLQEPSFIILAAIMVWQPFEAKIEESKPIPLISRLELKFSGLIVLLLSLVTIYGSGISFGFEYVIANLHLFFLGVIISLMIIWLLGSLVPRILYRHGILKRKSIEPRKPDEPLGKLFG